MKICPKSGMTCSWNCHDDDDDDDDGGDGGCGGEDSDGSNEEDFVHVNVHGAEISQSQKHFLIHLNFKNAQWIKVTKVDEIFKVFDEVGNVPYVLIGGNTAHGES
jgi:hypothetical protein